MFNFRWILGVLLATVLLMSSGVALADKGQGRSPPDSNLAECRARDSRADKVSPPARIEAESADQEDGALCPDGQVPHPKAKYVQKHRPQRDGDRRESRSQASGVPSLNMAAVPGPASIQSVNAQGIPAGGLGAGLLGTLSQHKPFLAAKDYHSLAELVAISADGRAAVEVGWTVDRGVNGDAEPHLFVYHWANGEESCYNGCGWVQMSPTLYPGMKVKAGGVQRQYGIEAFEGNWWVYYAGQWIGYFPEALWTDRFIEMGYAQWSGEVASVADGSCSDMGTGKRGTVAGAATFTGMKFFTTQHTITSVGETLRNASLPASYSFAGGTPSTSSTMKYGGPGAC